MNLNHLDPATLRASLDGELDAPQAQAAASHLQSCAQCASELQTLEAQAATVRSAFQMLPLPEEAAAAGSEAAVWTAILQRKDAQRDNAQRSNEPATQPSDRAWSRWLPRVRLWPLATAGLIAASLGVALTLAPVRAWAESLLAVFRVEHFTVLELNGNANGLQNNELLNQTVGHILSDDVTVTQRPQKPQPVADLAAATKLAGFPVKLLADETPRSILLEGGAAARMKLDRDRLQSILDEAGRSDIRIPDSVDGATVAVRVPPGILAQYGNCPSAAAPAQPADDTCISLMELPSPAASMPADVDPAQIAQVALEFFGMKENDAINFTHTVDWTSTLVLPVMRGESSYKQVEINGKEGVLLRPKSPRAMGHYTVMWVDTGIVFALNGVGDDTTALNLASTIQ